MLNLKGLKLGVATASAQIEGGEINSNWNTYSDLGKITDGSNVKRANDHWNRYHEDINILEELGIKYYRMSVEWARIEPENGKFSEDAILHYIDEIESMKSKGIEVLLTLHHFSHPQWFEDLKSFEKVENIDIFIRFVDFVVKRLGHLVSNFCTINEPNVYAVNGYFFGEWLQEEKNFFKTIKVLNVLAACHIKAFEHINMIFKENGWKSPHINFALHMRYFEPYKNNFIDKTGAKTLNFLFQTGVYRAFAKGEFKFPFRNLLKIKKGVYINSIGVNYYSRGLVKNFNDVVKEDTIKNDLGWEIYPEGIVKCAQMLYDILPLPIQIIENGTCDNTDNFRTKFIYDHLCQIVKSELPFTHYYHWCFTDNFEWKEGELPRFGIVHIDYETQKRTIKKSGYFYKDLIDKGAVSDEIFEKYIKDAKYHKGEKNILEGLLPEEELRNKR